MFKQQHFYRISRRLCIAVCVTAIGSVQGRETHAVEPPVTTLVFSPDGRAVLAASQAGVSVYDWPSCQKRRTFAFPGSNLHSLAFSPAGDRLAVAGGQPTEQGFVEIVAWPESKSILRIRSHEDSVRSVLWAGSTRLVTAGMDSDIRINAVGSESETMRDAQLLSGHSRGVETLCWLPDTDELVSAGIDQSLRVWDLASGECVRNLNQHTGAVHGIALRRGGAGLPLVASVAADRTVRFWQPTIGRMMRYVRLDAEPLCVDWLNDGKRVVVGCSDGNLRVIDFESVGVIATVPLMEGWIYAVAVHPERGEVAAAGSHGKLLVVEPAFPEVRR